MDVRFAEVQLEALMLDAARLDRAFGRICALRVRTRLAALYAVEIAAELFPLPGRWRPASSTPNGHLVADLDPSRHLLVAADVNTPALATDRWNTTTSVTVLGVYPRTVSEGGATHA